MANPGPATLEARTNENANISHTLERLGIETFDLEVERRAGRIDPRTTARMLGCDLAGDKG